MHSLLSDLLTDLLVLFPRPSDQCIIFIGLHTFFLFSYVCDILVQNCILKSDPVQFVAVAANHTFFFLQHVPLSCVQSNRNVSN